MTRADRSGVYSISNRLNGKVYIGSTTGHITYRWATHVRDLNKGTHPNRHLQRAWVLYGADAFDFSVLENVSPDQCLVREQWFLDKFKSANCKFGYNLSPTARSTLGVKLSPETCKRISISKKGIGLGRKMSDAAKVKMSRAAMGNKNGLGSHRSPSVEARRKRVVDLSGLRFDRLLVIEYYDVKPHARWLCRCDCGNSVIAYGNNLRKGNTKSCGCLLSEVLAARNAAGRGKKLTPQHRARIGKSLIGNTHNKWQKRKRDAKGRFS